MSEREAFALKESVKDFAGGSVAVGQDGKTADLKARLGDDGVIVVDLAKEPGLAQTLRENEAFKSADVPTDKSGAGRGGKE